MSLEVVWPTHRWDYLTVADPDMPTSPPPLPSGKQHVVRLKSVWSGAESLAPTRFCHAPRALTRCLGTDRIGTGFCYRIHVPPEDWIDAE